MKKLLGALVCVGVLGSMSGQAQDKAPAAVDPAQQAAVNADRQLLEQQARDLQMKLMQVEQGLNGVRMRLGLFGSRQKGGAAMKDEELAKLSDAAEAANKAVEQKGVEILKADPEGGPILAQLDDVQNKLTALQKQRGELEKSLWPIRQKLGLADGRGKKDGAATENPDITALRAAADAARKAIEDKMTERLKADPDGAKLLQERDTLNAQMNALRERGGKLKAERQP